MDWEQEALTFIQKLASHYFEQRDMNAVSSYLEERTSWIGTGQNEVSRNLEEARQALTRETEEYGGAFRITQLQCETAALQGTGCIVYGTVTAEPENPELLLQNVRFTAVTEHTRDGIRLLHLHFSHPDYLQERGRYYVPRAAAADNQALRSALAVRAKQLENLTKNIPGGAHQCANDPYLTLLSMSDSFLLQFGYTREEIKSLFQNRFINMIYPGDRAGMLRTVAEQLKKGPDIELEYRILHKNGRPIWILDKGRLMDDGEGGVCFYCLLVEINDRKREQEVLRLSLERHQVIMDQATDIIFEWDIAADTIDFSSNWEKRFGYTPITQNISKNIPNSDNIHPEDMPNFIKIMVDTAVGVPYSETEFRIRSIGGEHTWCRVRATTQFDSDNRPIKAVGVIVDISAERAEKLALLEQAQKDALTGLYNKAAVKTLVERQMYEKNEGKEQALLIIDLDHFKAVNDSYGHLCGDSLLSDIAAVLKSKFRSSDLIGRIGGDEFLVYLPEITDEHTVRVKAQEVLKAIGQIRPVKEAEPISCCIGAAVFPQNAIDYFSIYKCADRALYHMKNNGRNGIAFYDPAVCSDNLPSGLAHSAVSDFIESEKAGGVQEKLAQYVFHMLYESIDIETAVNRLLEIVGRAYNVSRVYIFESSEDSLRCNNTFEWCAVGVPPEIGNLQEIRYEEDLGGYLKNFDENGVFYCRDITTLHPDLYGILAPQGIRSVLQCAVLDKGKFEGYVGFDECRENCYWTKEQIDALSLISNVLAVFLTKLRLEERLAKLKGSIGEEIL